MEKAIIQSCILDRTAYAAVSGIVEPKETFSPIGQFWWKYIEAWYERDPRCRSIDPGVLAEQASAELDRAKSAETLRSILPSRGDESVSPANVVQTVLDVRKRSMLLELGGLELSRDRAKADKLFRRLSELWDVSVGKSQDRTEARRADELAEAMADGSRIRLLPTALSERINGGALPGQHIVVFGRTEIGKSTFLLNMLAGFLADELRCVYIGNEDSIDAIKHRFLCRVAKAKYAEARRDFAPILHRYAERRGEELVRFVHLNPGDVGAIEREVDDHDARIVIIDQIRNLSGPEDSLTSRLESNAVRVRSALASRSCLGISVTQAADRSERHNQQPPIWLGTGDCADSRVGLPAQADLMLGIGANFEMQASGQRAISICKNKLAAGGKSREGFICQFDLETGVVRS